MDDLAVLGVDTEDIQSLAQLPSLSNKGLENLGIALSIDAGNIGIRTLVVLEMIDKCIDDDFGRSSLPVFNFLIESFPEGSSPFLEPGLSQSREISLTKFNGVRLELSVLLFSAK